MLTEIISFTVGGGGFLLTLFFLAAIANLFDGSPISEQSKNNTHRVPLRIKRVLSCIMLLSSMVLCYSGIAHGLVPEQYHQLLAASSAGIMILVMLFAWIKYR